MKHYFLIAIIVLSLLAMVTYRTTQALFADTATASTNTFTAAAEFPTPTDGEEEQSLSVPTLTNTPPPTITPSPTPILNLVINEVSPLGSTAAEEWVELFNPTSSPINVSGWTIADGSGSGTDTIPAVSAIPAGGYAVVITSNSVVSGIPATALTIQLTNTEIGSGLNNTGDRVVLSNVSGVVDSMSYGMDTFIFPTPPTSPSGSNTLSRSPNGVDTNTASDWVNNHAATIGVSN